jgi:hypothetical protein
MSIKFEEFMPKDWESTPKYTSKALIPPPPVNDGGWVICSFVENGVEYFALFHETWLNKVERKN